MKVTKLYEKCQRSQYRSVKQMVEDILEDLRMEEEDGDEIVEDKAILIRFKRYKGEDTYRVSYQISNANLLEIKGMCDVGLATAYFDAQMRKQ